MVELEREKTYLLKQFPEGMDEWPSKIIADTYIPGDVDHAVLRLRQKGDEYEMTKKTGADDYYAGLMVLMERMRKENLGYNLKDGVLKIVKSAEECVQYLQKINQ